MPDNPKLTIHKYDKGVRHFCPDDFEALHKIFGAALLAIGSEPELVSTLWLGTCCRRRVWTSCAGYCRGRTRS